MDRDDRGPAPDHRTAEMEGRAISAPSQIGEALWRGRLRMGLSLDDVARRAGSALQTVNAIQSSDFARMARAQRDDCSRASLCAHRGPTRKVGHADTRRRSGAGRSGLAIRSLSQLKATSAGRPAT